MKRFMTATALTALIATGANAASERETTLINSYLPDLNVEALTDVQAAQLVSIAHGSDSRSDTLAKMEGLVLYDNPVDLEARMMTIDKLQAYAPGVDFSDYDDAELAQATAVVNAGGSRAEIMSQLTAFGLERDRITVDALTAAEIAQIRTYAPDLDIAALTDTQILRIQAAIAGGDSNQIDTVIAAIAAG